MENSRNAAVVAAAGCDAPRVIRERHDPGQRDEDPHANREHDVVRLAGEERAQRHPDAKEHGHRDRPPQAAFRVTDLALHAALQVRGHVVMRLPLATPGFELGVRLHDVLYNRRRRICLARVSRAPTLLSVIPSTSAISR